MKKARAEVTAVYTSEDGTVYDSTDGWRIESYGNDKVLAREVGGCPYRKPKTAGRSLQIG
jgi:hypothetical protein